MTNKVRKDSFQLKADFLPVTVLKLTQTSHAVLKDKIATITKKAPQYFCDAPILIDCSSLQEIPNADDLAGVCDILRDYKMQPIALRGSGLPSIDLPVVNPRTDNKTEVVKPEKQQIAKSNTVTINKPVRSGTQIYAKDSDLIILSSVNAGGEVIADGNIHVYGPLRGRALAGAKGDDSVSIFCQSLEAELVAVAGHYLVNENIAVPKKKSSMTQVSFDGQHLKISMI